MHSGDVVELNRRLKELKMPNYFSRNPRPYSSHWKGTDGNCFLKRLAVEFQNFTLFFFPALMKELLDEDKYLHFLQLED